MKPWRVGCVKVQWISYSAWLVLDTAKKNTTTIFLYTLTESGWLFIPLKYLGILAYIFAISSLRQGWWWWRWYGSRQHFGQQQPLSRYIRHATRHEKRLKIKVTAPIISPLLRWHEGHTTKWNSLTCATCPFNGCVVQPRIHPLTLMLRKCWCYASLVAFLNTLLHISFSVSWDNVVENYEQRQLCCSGWEEEEDLLGWMGKMRCGSFFWRDRNWSRCRNVREMCTLLSNYDRFTTDCFVVFLHFAAIYVASNRQKSWLNFYSGFFFLKLITTWERE